MSNSFRISQRSVADRTLVGLQANLARLGQVQEQLSSGKQVQRPSDSPTGAVSAMQFRTDIRVNEQWSRNASDGIGWLGTIDDTLSGSLGTVRKVRELTLSGMNTGGNNAQARDAVAKEIEALRDSLVGQANTTYLDRPVFGGTTAGKVAYQKDGTYVGESTGVFRTVSTGDPVRVDITGEEVFGTGDSSVFATLTSIADNLRNDPASLGADLGALDGHLGNITGKLADIGARYNRIELATRNAEDRILGLKSGLSDVEDIDLPKTIVEMQLAQTAYQAALGATAKVITPSLLEFLR